MVRREQKSYGVTGRIAGTEIKEGERMLFFDDVVSEGLSKIEGIKPLERLGAKIEHLMVVIDRERGEKENLEKLGRRLHSLAKFSDLVIALRVSEYIKRTSRSCIQLHRRQHKTMQ